MFQNGQRVCFKNGGDPARIQKVQLAYGKDRSRAPQVIPTTDPNATQVQVVTGEDAARYPFIDPIGLIGAPAAWFRADTGVTVTGLGASTWADQSGNGRDLLQSTDASRPPYLSYTGTKYLYLPGVAGNYASTPDSAANSITGDIDIRAYLSATSWASGSIQTICSKFTGSDDAFLFRISSTGQLLFRVTNDGSTAISYTSSTTLGFAAGSLNWVRVTRASATGAVNFYTSSDGSTWAALGTEQAGTSGAIFNSSVSLQLGVWAGTGEPLAGNLYRVSIYSTIGGTTPVVDFNPDLDGSDQAATITSSATGEVWTINKSGGLPAQIVGRPSLLFDGTADYLKTNAFTLNQPETVYFIGKRLENESGDTIFDGNTNLTGAAIGDGTASGWGLFITGLACTSASPANNSYGVFTAVFNGASSLTQGNLASPVTGDPGTANMGGFTLGVRGTAGGNAANIQVLEVILFPTAHDATQRARIIQYLMGRHGIA